MTTERDPEAELLAQAEWRDGVRAGWRRRLRPEWTVPIAFLLIVLGIAGYALYSSMDRGPLGCDFKRCERD
jgi:hypothetical protein